MWVAVLTGIGFLSVYTARQQEISSDSLVYAGFFFGLYAIAHLGLRAGLPDADPWLLPLSALLTAIGLTEIYRLRPTLARDQSVWIVVGLVGFLGPVLLAARRPPPGALHVHAGRRRRARCCCGRWWSARPSTAPSCGSASAACRCSRASSPSCCWSFPCRLPAEKREVLAMAHRRVLGIGLPARSATSARC